ncbi:MAG TPA: DNA alkylation repair protein [Clostridia bacterium]|nr:DNA alkylation repair protein [Clostridia bacterium]
MDYVRQVKRELERYSDPEKKEFFPRFFQAFPGGYGERDRFLGVTVPHQRRVAKQYYRQIPLTELEQLLQDPIHECRLVALFMLVQKFEKSRDEAEKEEIIQCYLRHLPCVNNWDLVDSSCYKLLGPYLEKRDRGLLYELAQSGHLWRQRIAMITTLHFIRQGDFDDAVRIAELLLDHPHDLIHKAVGWMLREVGNRDLQRELDFLDRHHRRMPRTMLRYAVEKLPPELRQRYLQRQG